MLLLLFYKLLEIHSKIWKNEKQKLGPLNEYNKTRSRCDKNYIL